MIIKKIQEDKKTFVALFIYAFLLIFFCSKMSPLYPFNEWSDVNLYFNIGKAIAHGKVPYTEVFDHKGPLIFFIYSVGYLISNTSFFGMYIIESLFWTIMIFAGYLTARLYLEKIRAFIIALLFPVVTLSFILEGGSAEEFILVFQFVSLYFFVRHFNNKDSVLHNPVYMFVHGAMCAMTLLIKMNLIVFWFFPLLAIFVPLLIKKEYRNLIQNAIMYLAAIVLVILPMCIYFLANNALQEAWNIYVTLNRNYMIIDGPKDTIYTLLTRFFHFARYNTFDFFIVMLGAIYFPIKYIGNNWGKVSIILSFFSLFIIIHISPIFFLYYPIPYYVYTVLGCIAICSYLRVSSTKLAYALTFIIILITGIKKQDFFGIKINALVNREIPEKSLVFQFSKHIEKEKDPTLLNLGLDTGNGVFTKTGILPSFKYFISPNLSHAIYPDMRDEQTRYIENKEPQLIILTDFSFNIDYFKDLPALVDNYTVIDYFYEENTNKKYYLYKRNE
ncbi:MAG: glycosyltransferase family 39 protein [Dysgonomonas sp.]|nr:glycosyltransferase family 39 protein [Dysgonomonas sp.]